MAEQNIVDAFLSSLDPYTPINTKYFAKPITYDRMLDQYYTKQPTYSLPHDRFGPLFIYIEVGPSQYVELLCTNRGSSLKTPRTVQGIVFYLSDLVNGYKNKQKRTVREYEMPKAVAQQLIKENRLFFIPYRQMKPFEVRNRVSKKNVIIAYGPEEQRFLNTSEKNHNFSENERYRSIYESNTNDSYNSNNQNRNRREMEHLGNIIRRDLGFNRGGKRRTHRRSKTHKK